MFDLDIEEKLRRRLVECDKIDGGINDIIELTAEILGEVNGDMQQCQKNPSDNKEIIKNLNMFTKTLNEVMDKVDDIQGELDKLVEDIQDCIDSRVKPNLTDPEVLSLMRENVGFKRRV